MQPYELLEHTADAKFRAYGKTLDEAFANTVTALAAIVTDPTTVGTQRSYTLTVMADSPKKLLFDFLDQIIFLMDTEEFLPVKADVHTHLGGISATIHGDDIVKHGGNIKAVTYSEMLVEETKDGWMVQAVIDI